MADTLIFSEQIKQELHAALKGIRDKHPEVRSLAVLIDWTDNLNESQTPALIVTRDALPAAGQLARAPDIAAPLGLMVQSSKLLRKLIELMEIHRQGVAGVIATLLQSAKEQVTRETSKTSNDEHPDATRDATRAD